VKTPRLLECDGKKLYLDVTIARDVPEFMVESTDLAVFLEYRQPGSIRKQIQSDWAPNFVEGEDFLLEQDTATLEDWARRRRVHLESSQGVLPHLAKVSAKRGRLFLLETGLRKALSLTSKLGATRLRLDLGKLSAHFRAPDLDPEVSSSLANDTPVFQSRLPGPIRRPRRSNDPFAGFELDSSGQAVLESSGDPVSDPEAESRETITPSSDPPSSLEERKFQHEVLQFLIQNLHQHAENPLLRRLALEAAETSLGRKINLEAPSPGELLSSSSELGGSPRVLEPPSRPDAPSAPPRSAPPVFTSGWHTMSEIGQMAGGFSASTAGKAADQLAAGFGVTPAQMRAQRTVFSRLVTLERQTNPRDRRHGRQITQVQFTADFANRMVELLRSDPAFTPKARPVLSSFDAGGEHLPKLSRPLDLDASS
jgi:hypothetical protein